MTTLDIPTILFWPVNRFHCQPHQPGSGWTPRCGWFPGGWRFPQTHLHGAAVESWKLSGRNVVLSRNLLDWKLQLKKRVKLRGYSYKWTRESLLRRCLGGFKYRTSKGVWMSIIGTGPIFGFGIFTLTLWLAGICSSPDRSMITLVLFHLVFFPYTLSVSSTQDENVGDHQEWMI